MRKCNIIKKKTAIFALAFAVLTGCVGCGNKDSKSITAFDDSKATRGEFAYESTEAYGDYGDYGDWEEEPAVNAGESYKSESLSMQDATATSDEAVSGSGAGNGANHEIDPNATNTLSAIEKDKLVFRCSLDFETLDYNASMDKIHQLIKDYNGFVEYEDVTTTQGYRDGKTYYTYSATIRVPSASFDSFVNETGDVGELISKNQNVDNFSKEYTDLSAELEVLEAKYDSYLEMMKEAKTLDDMETLLMIDDRITDVEIQISQIKRRMNTIDNDVAYSYVNIDVREVQKYEEAPAETFGDRISRALRDGWESFRSGCEDFAVSVSENLPQIIITIVIILLAWFLIIRKLLRALGVPTLKQMKQNRKARKAMKAQTAAAPNKEGILPDSSEVAQYPQGTMSRDGLSASEMQTSETENK